MTVDVASAFSDPDNNTLTYNALSSDPDRVAVTRTGSQLTLTPDLPGLAVVMVRATGNCARPSRAVADRPTTHYAH